MMHNIEALTHAVEFNDYGVTPSRISFDAATGFMRLADFVDVNTPAVIGFADPRTMTPYPTYQTPTTVKQSITEFADLPADMQTIDAQGKGVGTRVYNAREAFGGSRERVPSIDVVAFQPGVVLDWRPRQGGRVTQIARHAGLILRAKVGNVEAVVDSIHEKYDKAEPGVEAVLRNTPPHQEIRSAVHSTELPADMTPAFMIIRSFKTRLFKIGTTTSPW